MAFISVGKQGIRNTGQETPVFLYFPKAQDITLYSSSPATPSSLRVGGGPTEETNAQIQCHQRISTTHMIIGQDLSLGFQEVPNPSPNPLRL